MTEIFRGCSCWRLPLWLNLKRCDWTWSVVTEREALWLNMKRCDWTWSIVTEGEALWLNVKRCDWTWSVAYWPSSVNSFLHTAGKFRFHAMVSLAAVSVHASTLSKLKKNPRVSDQNGISLQWYIVKIYHSGRKPSKCNNSDVDNNENVPLSETTVRMGNTTLVITTRKTGTVWHILFLVTGQVFHLHLRSQKRVNMLPVARRETVLPVAR